MIKNRILFSLFLVLLFACGEKQESSQEDGNSNEWELVILDSIQVDILGEISTGDFRDNVGVLYDNKRNTLFKIDLEGNILSQKEYPTTGPESFQFLTTVEIDSLGGIYILNFMNVFYYLDNDLTIAKKMEMPFPSTSFDGATDSKAFSFYTDKIIMWYAGRDEKSPYAKYFLRDEFLLEKFDPKTGESSPMLRSPTTSKFSTDQLYDRPTISFDIQGDMLYLAFSNEPSIHVFDLAKDGAFIESLAFNPNEFILGEALKDEYEYNDFSKLVEGRIQAVYVDEKNLVVHFWGGMNEEQFAIGDYSNPDNFMKVFDQLDNYFKIHTAENGWSDEILIPKKVSTIFEIGTIDKPFFALRNDEYLGEEQDFITFYKLQLIKK